MSVEKATRRQEIIEMLSGVRYGFEELRQVLEIPVKLLDEELRHVERSVRSSGRRLRVEPARCQGCGFVFRGREPRRFYAPSRCPKCRGERISDPQLSIR